MIPHQPDRSRTITTGLVIWPRRGSRPRRSPGPRGVEVLENRVLLSPTVYTVTDISDDPTDTGSLTYAVSQANVNLNPDGSIIEFQVPQGRGEAILLSSPLELTGTVGPEVVAGPGTSRLSISGDQAVEVFQVAANVTASIEDLTITDGKVGGDGGGIDNQGTLTIEGCDVEESSAAVLDLDGKTSGGDGGGIFNLGTLTITDSTIANNTAINNGGGISNQGTLTITGSTVANNLVGTTIPINSTTEAFVGEGAGIFNQNALTVTDSTISSNITQSDGGGLYNTATALVIDSTIANNASNFGNGGGIDNTGTLTATSATIAGNAVFDTGAGLENSAGTSTLNDTIVALNTTTLGGTADDIDGNPGSVAGQYDLIGADLTNSLVNRVDGNQVGVTNPGLGALAGNGGPTETMALLAGSPAIEHGSVALDGGQTTDQRGAGYARLDEYGLVDIGAYEYFIPLPTHIYSLPISTQLAVASFKMHRRGKLGSVVLDAQIELATSGPAMPTGTVTFELMMKSRGKVKESVLGTAAVTDDMAMLTIKTRMVLNKSITVVYSGDMNYMSSTVMTPKVTHHSLERLSPTNDKDVAGGAADLRIVRNRLGSRLPNSTTPAAARPADRIKGRSLVTARRLRPDAATTGTPAAPATVSWPSQVYAPYVDMTLYPTPDVTSMMNASGVKFLTLGFVVADPRNDRPSWGGYPADDINGGAFDMSVRQQVSAVRQEGGDVMVSFGGEAGQELAQVVTNVKKLEKDYQTVIADYNLTQIDFDIEGAAEANHASINRRFRAVAALEQQAAASGRPLSVWLTLPALPTGLDSAGIYVMQSALAHGVAIAGVNLMTMDYGNSVAPNPDAMGQYAIQAAQALFGQLQGLYGSKLTTQQIWRMEGNTPMIGLNDVTSEVFSLQDAEELAAFAQQVGMGRISSWSLSRDIEDPNGALSYVENTSSSIVQQPYAFSKTFLGYED